MFRSELRRGINRENLLVGVITASAVAGLTFALTATNILPDLMGKGNLAQAIFLGAGTLLLLTAFHTAIHGYFGWRFQRGVTASARGDHDRAIRLLAILDTKGMAHYDPDGFAQSALKKSRDAAGH